MVTIALILFGLSVLFMLGEIYFEWEAGEGIVWPQTSYYVLIFGAILLMSMAY